MRLALGLLGVAALAACGGSADDAASGTATATSTASASAAGSGGSSSSSGAGGGATASTGTGAAPSCDGTGPAGDHDETLMFGGQARTYRVHVPDKVDLAKPAMLVMVFPGYTETSTQIEGITQMTGKSDAHGFVTVYVQGLSNSFNAGACCGSSAQNMVDDVGFVGAMIDAVSAKWCIDPKRVFSTGFSNGGMLSHRLACEMSDRIAAIGAVSGTMAIDDCMPARPVPVLHVHGTSDFVVGYDGGGFSGAHTVPETIDGWVQRDGCDATTATTYMKGDATCVAHSACTAGTAVELCTIDGGGHQWPGGMSAGPGGKLSTDLDASEHIVAFFEAHPLP